MPFRPYEPGELFADTYRIDAPLGEGGFAVVYAATEVALQRPVALKLLKPEGAGYAPQTRARFRRELRALSKLQGPHTIRMYNHGVTTDGLLYAVFEHVPGV